MKINPSDLDQAPTSETVDPSVLEPVSAPAGPVTVSPEDLAPAVAESAIDVAQKAISGPTGMALEAGKAFGQGVVENAPVASYNWKQGYGHLARSLTVQKHNLWTMNPETPEFKQALQSAYAERKQIEQSMGDMGADPTPTMRDNWFGHLLGKSSRMLPFMIESMLAGGKLAAATGPSFATGAAVVTPGPPQVKAAAAVPAFATGIRAGMTVGQVKYSMDVEGADIYWDMIDRGINPTVARNLSMAGGLGIGLVEVLSNPVLEQIPGLKNISGYTLFKNKFVNDVLSKAVGKYLADYGVEVGEEGLQEIIGNASNLMADAHDGRLVGKSRKEITDYLLKNSATAMKDAAEGMALVSVPGGIKSVQEQYDQFSFGKSVEAHREEVFDGKKPVEPRDLRIAVDAQIAYLEKEVKRGAGKKTEEQRIKLLEDIKFLKANKWNEDAISEKYKIPVATEILPGARAEYRVVADGVDGNNQRLERFSGVEARPDDSIEMLAADDSGKVPVVTHINLAPITDEERVAARDKAIDYLKKFPISIGGDQVANIPFYKQEVNGKVVGLPQVVQEGLIREINEATKKDGEAVDLAPVVNNYFKKIENSVFWEGGLPTEEGGDFDVWYGKTKDNHTASQLPTTLALAKSDYSKLNIVALRHPSQDKGITGQIRKLLQQHSRRTNVNLNPTINVQDVDSSASNDRPEGDKTPSRSVTSEARRIMADSVSDYEYVARDGSRITAKAEADGALYHGVQNFKVDPKTGALTLKPHSHGLQFGINFSMTPVVAMFYAEQDNNGQRRKPQGVKVVRISPEANVDLKLVQENYEELFSKSKSLTIPRGRYQIFEATEPREKSEKRIVANHMVQSDLVDAIIRDESNPVLEDELIARAKAGKLQLEVSEDQVAPLNTVLEKLRLQGRLNVSAKANTVNNQPNAPTVREPVTRTFVNLATSGTQTNIIRRSWMKGLPVVGQQVEFYSPDGASVKVEVTRVLKASDGWQVSFKLSTEKIAPEAPKAKIEASQPALPKGVVPRGRPMTEKDVNITKLNQLRRMSDAAGSLAHIPVRVLTGDQTVASDGMVMSRTDEKGNKVESVAKVGAKRDTIYVQQTRLEAAWDKYFTRKRTPKAEGEANAGVDWLLDIMPAGLTKEEFYKFVIEHERVHLATGIDGSKHDEIIVSIIALERMGKLEHASELQSKIKFPDLAKYRVERKEYIQKRGRDQVVLKGPEERFLLSGVEDVVAKPVAGKYSFTGVGFVDQSIENKHALHPAIANDMNAEANKVRRVKAHMAVENQISEQEIEIHGVLDVVEDFIRRHNLEGQLANATMREVAEFVETLNPILKDELIREIQEKAPHGEMRMPKNEFGLTRGVKSSWEIAERSDAKQPKSVFDLVETEQGTNRPVGLNEQLSEAELTREELQVLQMKREHFERSQSFQYILENIAQERSELQEDIQDKIAERDRLVQNGADPNGKQILGREKTIRKWQDRLAELDKQAHIIGAEQSQVEAYSQKELDDLSAQLPPGSLNRVDAFLRSFKEFARREALKEGADLAEAERSDAGVPPSEAVQQLFDDPEAAESDQVEDFFGGLPKTKPIPPTVPSSGSAPSRPLGEHSRILKTFLAVNRMNWAKLLFGGGKGIYDIEDKAKMKSLDKGFAPYRSGVVEKLTAGERAEQFHQLLGGMTEDKINQAISEVVDQKVPKTPFGRSEKSRKLREAYNAILVRAAEEIRASDKPGVGYATNIGIGGTHTTIEEGAAFVAGMTRVYEMMKEAGEPGYDVTPAHTSAWANARPRLNYFSLLPAKLQDLVIWWAGVQKEWLNEQILAGVYDAQNVYKLEQEGYFHRIGRMSALQEQASPARRGPLASMKEPSRKEYRTYDEFAHELDRVRMFAGLDFGNLAGLYISESARRMARHHLIEMFGKMPGPDGLNIVMFADDVVAQGLAKRDQVQAYLLDKGYIQLKRGAGLAEHYNGGFRVPYVHRSAFDIYEQLIKDRERTLPGGEHATGAIAGAFLGGLVGLPVGGPLGAIGGAAVGSAAMAAVGYSKVNYIMKRVITLFSHVFVAQTTFNAAMWQAEKDNPVKVFGEWFTDIASIYVKGPKRGLDVLRGVDRPYSVFKENKYEATKLLLLTKHGLPGVTFDWHMRALFDKAIDSRHPQARPVIHNLQEWMNTKGGLDKVAFENVISKWVYRLASQIYDMEYAKGWSEETAARRAAVATADMSQIMNTWSYGQEAAWLQALMFARDNTVALLRQGSGALFPIWSKAHQFRTGRGSLFNTILHGKESKSDVYALSSYYLNNIAKIFFWNQVAMNLIQYSWTMSSGDDEAKKKPWAWQNEGMNKFRVRAPFKQPGTNRWVYLDSMVLREMRYYAQLLTETPNYVNARWSWLISTITQMQDNKDVFGTMISNPEPMTLEEALDAYVNRAKFVAGTATPRNAGDVIPNNDMEAYFAYAGLQLIPQEAEQPGLSYEATKEMRAREAREQYYQDQLMEHLRLYPKDDFILLTKGLEIDGKLVKLTPESWESWKMRQVNPQGQILKRVPGQLLREAQMGIRVDEERNVRFGIKNDGEE